MWIINSLMYFNNFNFFKVFSESFWSLFKYAGYAQSNFHTAACTQCQRNARGNASGMVGNVKRSQSERKEERKSKRKIWIPLLASASKRKLAFVRQRPAIGQRAINESAWQRNVTDGWEFFIEKHSWNKQINLVMSNHLIQTYNQKMKLKCIYNNSSHNVFVCTEIVYRRFIDDWDEYYLQRCVFFHYNTLWIFRFQ